MIRFVLITSALVLWALGVFAQGVGPSQQFYPVYDFRNDWLVYDPGYKSYVPYIDEQHASIPAVSVFVDVESNRRYNLLVSTEADGYLFINSALKRKLVANTWQIINLDSLYRIYRTPELFVTIYGRPGVDDKLLYIGHQKTASQKTVVVTDSGLSILPRRMTVYGSFFTLSLLLILTINAYLFNVHHRAYLRFFDLTDLLSVTMRDELFLVNRPLNRVNILFILNLSFILAYLFLVVQTKNIDIFSSRALLLRGQRLDDLIITFLELSGLAFLLMMGKYLLLLMIGGLYKLEEIVNLHFFKLIQSSLLFFTAFLLVVSILAVNTPVIETWSSTWLMFTLIAFYVGRLILLYIVIAHKGDIKNLYLFSYLCIVELIPLIIGMRFAL